MQQTDPTAVVSDHRHHHVPGTSVKRGVRLRGGCGHLPDIYEYWWLASSLKNVFSVNYYERCGTSTIRKLPRVCIQIWSLPWASSNVCTLLVSYQVTFPLPFPIFLRAPNLVIRHRFFSVCLRLFYRGSFHLSRCSLTFLRDFN